MGLLNKNIDEIREPALYIKIIPLNLSVIFLKIFHIL